jgi:hypothetical protein
LGVGRSEHVAQLNTLLARASTAVGGTYVPSPFFAALGEQEITVHAMYALPDTCYMNARVSNNPLAVEHASVVTGQVLMAVQITLAKFSKVLDRA